MSELARGLGCGGPLDAGVCKRWVSRALRRPSHGGGEVASAGRSGARGEVWRFQREQRRAVGRLRRDAWSAWQAGGGLGAAQRDGRAAYGTSGGKQRSRQEEEEKDPFAISKNSRDHSVNK